MIVVGTPTHDETGAENVTRVMVSGDAQVTLTGDASWYRSEASGAVENNSSVTRLVGDGLPGQPSVELPIRKTHRDPPAAHILKPGALAGNPSAHTQVPSALP